MVGLNMNKAIKEDLLSRLREWYARVDEMAKLG